MTEYAELPYVPVRESATKVFMPALIVIVASFAMLALRMEVGASFISDGALMMLALACYILAALFQLTNLWAPSSMSEKIAYWGACLGVFFNLSSWLVRWVAFYEHEIAIMRESGNQATPWIFRYIPFANLYDLSLAFAFGAGIASILFAKRRSFRMITAFTLPLAALILSLARFIGGEFVNLPPVLDSYWRPIHVGTASLSYGVALVCFAVAVIYLLKDGVKVEAMAIWSSLFAFSVIATVSKFSVFSALVYRAGLFVQTNDGAKPFTAPFRLDLPYAGPALALAGALLAGVIVAYSIYIFRNSIAAQKIGRILLIAAFAMQIVSLGIVISGIKTTDGVYSKLQTQLAADPYQMTVAGMALAENQQMTAQELSALTATQYDQMAKNYLQRVGDRLYLSLNTNPVEVAALLTAIVGTFFVILFGIKTEKLRAHLPSLDALDSLMYKTGCLAFAGLAMLLITGAIWANESWGRPWGFDSKETGALVAWLTYAGFIHARISRGWKGRPSAYFAIAGFLFVIFTYLGVSYLLKGLHSYV
ncbi:MAG: cytochrome c biogenesis protein CcsA [Chloracidobacterium sp.]|nr:cytochrome c biogenesis protein CcsA [Chloracidobacterium sp.]MCO5334916.1 cytochrome c biogenesis protein CcsA [Pyrinomonadaceae bacterium]